MAAKEAPDTDTAIQTHQMEAPPGAARVRPALAVVPGQAVQARQGGGYQVQPLAAAGEALVMLLQSIIQFFIDLGLA